MPECLLLAYHDNLDRLRAERSLDAAQAASVPHLSKEGHKSWYRETQRRTTRSLVAPSGGAAAGHAVFTVNGQAVDKAGLARWLAQTFGAPAFGARPVDGARLP